MVVSKREPYLWCATGLLNGAVYFTRQKPFKAHFKIGSAVRVALNEQLCEISHGNGAATKDHVLQVGT